MSNTMFAATHDAGKAITRTFDMVWPLVAGLWNIRQASKDFFVQNPNASNKDAKRAIISGLNVRGLDFRGIFENYTWEDEEEYISEILLINAIAIFDTWVDSFVDVTLPSVSATKKKNLKEAMKKGDFADYEATLALEPNSVLKAHFRASKQRKDAQIGNLLIVYKYYKACRNCIAHGNRIYTDKAENCYNSMAVLTAQDCGIKELPKPDVTVQGQPLKLVFRGVVGLYDVLLCIVYHYDIVASDKTCIELEIANRWRQLQGISLCRNVKKRNNSIRNYFKSIDMCPPLQAMTDDVYDFLKTNNLVTQGL